MRGLAGGLGCGLCNRLQDLAALLLVYFLLIRKRKVLISGLLSLALLTMVTVLLFSPEVLSGFLVALGRLSKEILPSGYNASFLSISCRLLSQAGTRNLELMLPAVSKGLLLLLLLSMEYWSGNPPLPPRGIEYDCLRL